MKQSTSSPCHDLSAKIAFLSRPQSYPEDAGHVEVLETHLSWLFLTSWHVYKMKKPVRYPFVDLSTLALRRRNCAEEMRLNRMLASEVYLDLVQLSWQAERGYSLEGEGMPAEVLVKMLRLPQQACLEWQLQHCSADADEVRAAGIVLARFYSRAAAAGPLSFEALRTRWRRMARELEELSLPGAGDLVRDLELWVRGHEQLLARRCRIEVHGDLRPQHVFLGRNPQFIDRLEFSRELRLMDPLEELAFFAMECERLEGPWAGRIFLDAYRECSGDRIDTRLTAFYTAHRALLWALLSARHVARGGDSRYWHSVASEYLQRGRRAVAAC